MAAKSFGTPSTIESSEVSRHTKGSNHIWKTSSGKSDLKSHFTVSQRLGVRDEEGMKRTKGRVYSHCVDERVFTWSGRPHPTASSPAKIRVQPSCETGYGEENYKL